MTEFDPTDGRLIDLLRVDGRATLAALGQALSLSPAAVKRRMHRLQAAGVIRGYTVVVDEHAAGRRLQAFVELRVSGDATVEQIDEIARDLHEVQAFFTTAGDPDALAWVAVEDMEHLRAVIAALRAAPAVTGTKTLMVLGLWQR